MKILIGVDDSPHSKAALEFVKTMKWPTGTRCVVLSAAPPLVASYSLGDAGVASWMTQAEQESVQQAEELTARVERELREVGLATEARVVRGDAREALVETALRVGADLMVVGSHGRTGLARLLLGSVASHVVSHAPCNVLVVRPKQP